MELRRCTDTDLKAEINSSTGTYSNFACSPPPSQSGFCSKSKERSSDQTAEKQRSNKNLLWDEAARSSRRDVVGEPAVRGVFEHLNWDGTGNRLTNVADV